MAEGGSGSSFGFLSQKTGPFPLWVWIAGGIGIWYLVLGGKKGSGTASPAAQQSQTGYGTDPAGNTGYIDPQSGYVYGSAEDIAALQQQGQVAANTYSSSGSTVANQYPDNATWGRAAVNYLVGIGIDPTQATEAVQQYLAGQQLTSQQQGDVNLAIQAIGAPPQLPGPVGTPPGNVVPPPGGGGSTGGGTGGGTPPPKGSWQYPAPTGLRASGITSKGFDVSWNPVTGPAGQRPSTYTVATYQMNGKQVDQFQSGATSTKEYGAGGKGLVPGYQYRVNVWANGGPKAPPHASIVVSLPKGK